MTHGHRQQMGLWDGGREGQREKGCDNGKYRKQLEEVGEEVMELLPKQGSTIKALPTYWSCTSV